MSEDNVLGTSHLCAPEDAFEQFQAVSMYEENEYITLADIVPPQPSVPDYGDLSQIPYDNEVILTTSDEPGEEIMKDTTREIEQPIQQDSITTQLDSSDNNDLGQSFVNSTVQPQPPKKRGRKKKNLDEKKSLAIFDNDISNTMENSGKNQDITIEKSPNIQNNSLLVGTRPVRRGRPPKKLIDTDILTDLPGSTQTKTSESSVPSQMANLKPTRGRKKPGCPRVNRGGRPKSTKVSNDQLLSAADSTTLLSSEKSGSENDKVDNNSLIKTSSRRRKASKLSSEFINDQTEPREESLIENNGTNVDDQSVMLSNKKSAAKRFKRTKVEQQLDIQEVEGTDFDTLLQSLDNKLSQEPSTLENDELDDISLSQLKHVSDDSTLLSPTIEQTENNLESISKNDDNVISDFGNKTPKKSGKRGRPKKSLEVSAEIPEAFANNEETPVNITEHGEEDETDDLCLSQLKETIQTDTTSIENSTIVDDAKINMEEDNKTPAMNSTKTSLKSDFEYNIDGTTNNTNETSSNDPDQSLLVEDSSKRPVRRRVKQTLHYEQESDEDPFANLPSSSDDEPKKGRNRKGNRYHSDEEYYPGSKRGKISTDTGSDSEMYENLDDTRKQKKKILRKKSDTQSPRKQGKKAETNITTDISKDDDIEEVLQSSLITTGDEHAQPLNAWGSSNEFENFIAKKIQGTDLKIKKVSSAEPSETNITPLEIPVINQKEKKTVEMCSQTNAVSTESTSVQTSTPFDIAMIENISLTKEQSEKACQFLNSIVQTTAELGQLMTQKSEDFIKKKIHTEHVTDTFKMDYCVRKSFLLFKLAKHNLMQMEEDLAKQYENFLEGNKLSYCREKQKELAGKPKPKKENSDSDCEIVEEIQPPKTSATTNKKPDKSKFNPKTVFLNKELSIKIAKKPTEPQKPQKKIDIKGRHTVWISDTVMVKKVKPTQSFLAQDSRNKKPPDTFVTTEMVSKFFTSYYRQRALTVCAPFISTEWGNVSRECVCNYFVVKPVYSNASANFSTNEEYNLSNTASSVSISNTNNLNDVRSIAKAMAYPEPLFKLCFRVIRKHLHLLNNIKKIDNHNSICNKLELQDGREQPLQLFKLCLNVLTHNLVNEQDSKFICTRSMTDCTAPITVPPLKTLCYRRVVTLGFDLNATHQEIQTEETLSMECIERESSISPVPSNNKNRIKSLFSLCVELIQNQQNCFNSDCTQLLTPNTLKQIVFENIKYLLYKNSENKTKYNNLSICRLGNEVPVGSLTINSVNTLSEEAFLNLEQPIDLPESSDYINDDFDNDDSDAYGHSNIEPDFNGPEEEASEETNWVSQVQMQELRSFPFNTSGDIGHKNEPTVTQIKLEPVEEVLELIEEPTAVKTEPCIGLDEMTIIPSIDPIKPEICEDPHPRTIQRQDSSSYDVDAFESFARSSKLMNSEEYNNEDIFSQSVSRIRRQHEPDLDEDNDMGMSLLVPQTFEPIRIENAKGCLMESSSDESSQNKKVAKKKIEVKKRGRPKKINKPVPPATPKDKITNDKDKVTNDKDKVTNDKDKVTNEVAILTRRMRERIRQEEKKDESSDSENENLPLILKNKKDNNEKSKTAPSKNSVDTEIQCNNVDSTEHGNEAITERFSGFTAIDQNETSSYQKFMKYVYDKIVSNVDEVDKQPKMTDVPTKNDTADVNIDVTFDSPVFESNEPIELLECEPTMPIFDDVETKSGKKRKEKKSKPVEEPTTANVPFIERNGWKCYPVDNKDSKLYQNASICLEKLPEHFVETYFRYRDVKSKNKDDAEVDRLTNLSTLKRNSNLKEPKISGKSKRDKGDRTSEQNSELGSRAASPANSDRYDELTPSEDEGRDAEDEIPTSAPKQTENILAKDSLMNDSDSDGGTKVKQEPTDEPHKNTRAFKNKSKVSPQKVEHADPDSLMLTADKVMNKELNLLHAPVVLDEDVKDSSIKKPITRSKQKSTTKHQSIKGQNKSDEDYSSEEEKQWVNTKEKLLKRLGKKDDTSADDAKRAKLVSEFIERRADHPDAHKRPRGRGVRSRKKFLERQKQFKVLSRELFGETSIDAAGHNKRSAQAYFKGRRNIRKVIDKKSLARSTVVANMEEFERKRRLNARQTRLRELLGCEEGVNVLVINDEVCLEYDFEECRPVVTIHPFFTKVMKAHQYEGVKFMWDACFESLSVLHTGHAGGGCILAHCMGLGKTLQVLALLHTVLTHPQVGMRRVLVCCPLSTVLNWVDEIHKWLGPVTNSIKVFELSKLKKTYERAYQLEDWYNGGGIFIIGYELFRSLSTMDPYLDDVRPTIVNKIRMALLDPGPDIIVCDEGHLLKNDCSVLAVAMSRVATKRRIVLTGTPMQNNLREYYCMVDFVKPNLLGTYPEYSNRFENPIMNGQHRDSLEADIKLMKARTHILHKVLEGCLQRQEASVLYPYLPKKHEYTVFIPLTDCQWDMYKHYLTYYRGKHGILKDFHILHKIWSHPQVLHNFQTKAADDRLKRAAAEKLEDDLAAEDIEDIKPNETELWWLPLIEGGNTLDSLESSNKFMVVFKILEECIALGDKMLLFSTSLLCLDGLEYFLKKINNWSLGHEYFRLDGSVPAEVRQKWCREFNAEHNEKTKLFLVSTRAGCLGLNMTAANRVVILDTSWNPAHDIQSIFRVYRFGQKKDCYIYRLVAMGTMEQKIYERSVTKQAVACRVVDEQQIDRHYNSADLTELYKYDDSGSSVAGGVAVGVQDVVLLRVARAVPLHAVHEHDSLLRGSEPALPEHERAAAWNQFQQEQEDRQVQNKLVSIPKIPLKRVYGHEYAKIPVQPALVIKGEDTSDDYVPPGPKSRKGKKVVKVCIPVNNDHPSILPTAQPVVHISNILKHNTRQSAIMYPRRSADESILIPDNKDFQQAGPSRSIPSVQFIGSKTAVNEDEDEEAMVQKISNILVKHNFQDRKMDIGTLIAQVKGLVTKKNFRKSEMPDELSRSIAEVLLGDGGSLQPAVASIVCESISTVVQRPQPDTALITGDLDYKPRPKSKKFKVATPTELNLIKTKRKAAIEAEKSIDNLAQDVINLDDDDDDFRGDDDYMPDIPYDDEIEIADEPPVPTPPSSIKMNTKESKKPTIDKQKATPVANDVNDKIEKSTAKTKETVESNSILLSDDEESPVPEASKAPEDDEIVPLPRSLLTNKNFIKIVAHTYSAGNPMLDNDAATLAAQYSTFRALKEAEETGKDIVSGPIYDIANNVLGKTTLKKLLTVNDKVKKSAEDTAALQFKENLQAFETNAPNNSSATQPSQPAEPPKMYTVQTRTEALSAIERIKSQPQFNTTPQVRARITADGRKIVKIVESRTKPPMATSSAVASVSTNVVPVGLIKRGTPVLASQQYAAPLAQPYGAPAAPRDECILPDDDLRLLPDHVPPAAPTPTPAPPQPIPAFTRLDKTKSHTLNDLLNNPRRNAYFPQAPATEPNQKPMLHVAMGRVMPPDAARGDTICLDSDDEETIVPHVTQAASTASAGAGPASVVMASAELAAALHPAPPALKPMLLQNKLPQGSAQRKFVLVPASQVPPEILNNIPEKAKQSNPRPQSVAQTAAAQIVRVEPKRPKETHPPAAAGNFKVSKTKCKPGDIFRISESGQIEVLSKDDEKAAGITAGAAKTKEPAAAVLTSEKAPSVTPQKAAAPRSRRSTVSSSSSSSRSSSPEDPLSILKDVVHIQAAVDHTPKNPSPPGVPKTIVTKHEKNKNTSLQHVVSVHSKVQKPTASSHHASTAKSTTDNVTKVSKVGGDKNRSVFKIEKKPVSEVGKTLNKNVAGTNKASNSGVLNKSNSNKTVATATANKTAGTVAAKSKAPTKVVGNLKNMVLDGSGKGLTVNTKNKAGSVDLTGQKSVQVTNIKKIPAVAPTKADAKKRPPAETDTSAATKKRKPMTLKDFDLDDLDDIIELD